MDGDEVLLLQYSYTLQATISASLIKRLAMAFGTAITPLPLRHAILAYTCLQLQSELFAEQWESHDRIARRTLRIKCARRDLIIDGDVFAAMMLAWTALCRGSHKDAASHAHGCLSLLSIISSTEGDTKVSPLLKVFKPFILDDMSTIISMAGDSVQPAKAPRRSSFSERLTYYHELCHTGTPSEAWQTPKLETTYNYLRGAIGGALHSLRNIVTVEGAGLDASSGIKILEDYITEKVTDPDFRETLISFDQALLYPTWRARRPNRSESQLMGYQTIGLEVLYLILSILERPTILEGLTSPGARRLSRQIYSAATLHGRPVESLSYYCDLYYCIISISAMTMAESQQREYLFHNHADHIQAHGF